MNALKMKKNQMKPNYYNYFFFQINFLPVRWEEPSLITCIGAYVISTLLCHVISSLN